MNGISFQSRSKALSSVRVSMTRTEQGDGDIYTISTTVGTDPKIILGEVAHIISQVESSVNTRIYSIGVKAFWNQVYSHKPCVLAHIRISEKPIDSKFCRTTYTLIMIEYEAETSDGTNDMSDHILKGEEDNDCESNCVPQYERDDAIQLS